MAKAWRVSSMLLGVAVLSCGPSDASRNSENSAVVDATSGQTPFLSRVDHLFASSPQAEALFSFFRDTLGLPVSWPFKRYGDFASGGLSLGNTELEFVHREATEDETPPTAWRSFAFEPVGDTEAALKALARRRIGHSPPAVYRYRDANGQERVGWTNTDLTGLPPSGVAFICDYADREGVHASHKVARDELVRRHGGSLGVIRLKEIVIGVIDVAKASEQWRRLLASAGQESDGLFTFGDGPGIRLVPAETDGIRELVIGVRSLDDARGFLADRGLLEIGDGARVSIAPAAIGGLQIRLVVD